MARHALSFKFRLEELTQEGRAFEDEIAQADVAEAIGGLVGELGYRALKAAQVTGTAYRVQGDEVVIHGSLATEVGTFNYDGATATDVANMGPIPLCP